MSNPPKPKYEPAPPAPEPELPVSNGEGEFVIDRDIDPAEHDTQVVHIDKDGNLKYEQ